MGGVGVSDHRSLRRCPTHTALEKMARKMLQSAQIWRQICGMLRGAAWWWWRWSGRQVYFIASITPISAAALYPSFSKNAGFKVGLVRLTCQWRNDNQSHLLIHRSEQAFKNLLSPQLLVSYNFGLLSRGRHKKHTYFTVRLTMKRIFDLCLWLYIMWKIHQGALIGGSKKTKVKSWKGALSNPIPFVKRSSEQFLFLL